MKQIVIGEAKSTKSTWCKVRATFASSLCLLAVLVSELAMAAPTTVKIGVGTGIGYLPLQVMVRTRFSKKCRARQAWER